MPNHYTAGEKDCPTSMTENRFRSICREVQYNYAHRQVTIFNAHTMTESYTSAELAEVTRISEAFVDGRTVIFSPEVEKAVENPHVAD